MRREEVIERIVDELQKLGVQEHMRAVMAIPGYVEADILYRGKRHRFEFRSGITQRELDYKMAEVRTAIVLQQSGQRDIEDK